MNKVSIIISNWNGKNLLRENLPSVIEAIRYSDENHELIVIDDASSDGSQKFIKRNYPGIKLIELRENKGFGAANNIAVAQSNNEIIVLLNSDMSIEKDYFYCISPYFDDEAVFAVTPKMITEDIFRKKFKITISCWAEFRHGFWYDLEVRDLWDKEGRRVVLTVPGGGVAFSKKKFLSLGGFNSLYYPFYYEDADLSYCAWKRGWTIIYEPATVVYHRCSMTIGKYFGEYASLIKIKNYYLFIWKNITDGYLIFVHILVLPFHFLAKLLGGRWLWVKGFFLALKQLREALVWRKVVKKESILSDRVVLNLFKVEEVR